MATEMWQILDILLQTVKYNILRHNTETKSIIKLLSVPVKYTLGLLYSEKNRITNGKSGNNNAIQNTGQLCQDTSDN